MSRITCRQSGIARHEQDADRIVPGLGQGKAEPGRLLGEEPVRDLDQDAGPVARARIGADRAAMLEIAEDRQRILHELVRFAALDVGDEADPAGNPCRARGRKALARAAARARRHRDAVPSHGSCAAPRVSLCLRDDVPRPYLPHVALCACTTAGAMIAALPAHPSRRSAERRHGPKAPLVVGSLLARRSRLERVAAHGWAAMQFTAVATQCRRTAGRPADIGRTANWDSNAVLVQDVKFYP